MNYRGIELKLRQIVERRLEEGWNVRPRAGGWISGRFDNMGAACCAIGAVAIEAGGTEEEIDRSPRRLIEFVGPMLGVDYYQLDAISDGFEGWAHPSNHERGYQALARIGARIRRDYCESDPLTMPNGEAVTWADFDE